jgi:hypothetical protein
MFLKRQLQAFGEKGTPLEFSDSQSRFEPETSRTGFWTATYLLICMIDHTSRDRKQGILNKKLDMNENAATCFDFLVLHWINIE